MIKVKKHAKEKTKVENFGYYSGLEILNQFKLKSCHIDHQDDAIIIYEYLKPYLTLDEQHKLFVAWEKTRFGLGHVGLIEITTEIKDRMER